VFSYIYILIDAFLKYEIKLRPIYPSPSPNLQGYPFPPTLTLQRYMHYFFCNPRLLIMDKTGIPPDAQYLTFEQRVLVDGHTLSDYNIQNECNISMRLRLGGGGLAGCTQLFIRFNNDEFEVYINLNNTIMEAVHQEICESVGVKPNDHTSQRGTYVFDLNNYAHDYNFTNGSVINLKHTPGRVTVKQYILPPQPQPYNPPQPQPPKDTTTKRSRSQRRRQQRRQRSLSPTFSNAELYDGQPHPEAASSASGQAVSDKAYIESAGNREQ